jgi:ATP-dependent Clp protease protease subunit
MIHQPYGGAQGQAVDIQIQAKEILRMREELDRIIARHTGQPLERVEKDSDRDFFMSPEEAKDYGLVDEVIHYRDVAKRAEGAPTPASTAS